MNWKYWIKKHWWKIIFIVLIPLGLCILWWIKNRQKADWMFADLSEQWYLRR